MILMFHGVVSDSAPPERSCNGQAIPVSGLRAQLEWLRAHREVVPLEEYLRRPRRRSPFARRRVALTFDDGLGAAFSRLHPLLRDMDLPATLFVSTAHLNGGPLLWFAYLNALCFESAAHEVTVRGRVFSLRTLEERRRTRQALEAEAASEGDPVAYVLALQAEHPASDDWMQEYGGMTHAELAAAAQDSLLEVGSHTIHHPWLSRQSRAEQANEIEGGSAVLTRLIGRPVRYFAYPGGDYDARTVELLQELGFDAAFATLPKKLGSDPRFEIGRIGVYSRSLGKMRLKVMGAATLARRLGRAVG